MAKKIVNIIGTHCQACKTLIEEVCKEVAGVSGCRVDYQTGRAEIDYANESDWQNIVKAIESLKLYHIGDIQD